VAIGKTIDVVSSGTKYIFMSAAEILGYAAGAVTAFTFLPQVIKTWREQSAKDISLTMFLIAFINEIMWLIYGFMINNFVIILTNAVMLLMSGVMILLKLKYGRS
jgi:MtN3 and saliva related transmembrane protein